MIDKIWNWMLKISDKAWHYIGFRELTSLLLKRRVWTPTILIIVIILAIGKEWHDWYKGENVDFGDLLADVLGILMAFIN